ncbi:redoxin domain-containing protein [Flavobacterium sp. J27]|uniref:redoxin domain-containing protein n=1 Tax=Flavobacterium sp. J27 TaxID=2060419 RepID=UPI00102FA8C9|nr:redoxin domain-containing protein [Flavobacterium sp. J27]
MLQKGDKAPKFSAKAIINAQQIELKSGQWTYLSFHRFAACPFCVLRTRELITNYKHFQEKNIEIISIWPSTIQNMLQYVATETAPFPLIADPKKGIFKQYQVTRSSHLAALKLLFHPVLIYKALKGKYKKITIDADSNLLPAEFLINPEGILVMAYYGKHYGDHLPIEQILNNVV